MSSASLTPKQIRELVQLSRLELTAAELDTLVPQLGDILGYVAQLQQVNTDGVEPLAHALDVANIFRSDEPGQSLPAGDALANAPRRQQDFFSVPAVLD